MQIRRILILITLIASLVGCATQAKYDKKLYSWKGQSIEDLFSSWGYPASSFVMPNGNTMYVYTHSSTMTVPTQIWPNGQVNPLSGQQVEHWCKTYFEVNKEKKILHCSYEGNACVSR